MDGAGPGTSIIVDAGGALYGTTEYGGDLAGDAMVSNSHRADRMRQRFCTVSRVAAIETAPLASLTMDSKGNLYGATLLGGGATACGQTIPAVTSDNAVSS